MSHRPEHLEPPRPDLAARPPRPCPRQQRPRLAGSPRHHCLSPGLHSHRLSERYSTISLQLSTRLIAESQVNYEKMSLQIDQSPDERVLSKWWAVYPSVKSSSPIFCVNPSRLSRTEIRHCSADGRFGEAAMIIQGCGQQVGQCCGTHLFP